MASFTILHAADIHLDSPLRGLERYEGAPVDRIRGATREAFRALVDLAIAEEVRLVLLAGDLHGQTSLTHAFQCGNQRVRRGYRAFHPQNPCELTCHPRHPAFQPVASMIRHNGG